MSESSNRKKGLKLLEAVFRQGSQKAQKSLEMMINRQLEVNTEEVSECPFEEVCSHHFPEDVPVAVVLLRLREQDEGYLAFVMFEESAKKVNQILWEEVPETSEVLNVSNVSALKEMSNIVGSCFLNELADASGIELRPSEPVFVYDLMAAIMQAILLEQSLTSDKAILVDSQIVSPGEGISFQVMFLPSRSLFEEICTGLVKND